MAGEASETGASTGDIRSAILSELSSDTATEAEAEAAPAEEAVEAEAAPAEEVEAAGGGDDDPPEDESDDGAPVDDEEADPELKSDDPKVQKGLDAVRVAEKRMRATFERDRAAFEAERQKWQAQVDKVAEFEALAKRAKYDPAGALRALGMNEDDFELAAHALYGESKAATADPKQKAAALARLKEREKEDRLDATQKEIAELKSELAKQRTEARMQAEAAAYIQQINTTAAAKFPLVAQYLKADPDDTSDKLVAEYNRLSTALNRAPKPAEVVAAFDKRERARLAKLGIDPAVIVKPKAAANSNKAKPAAKPAAPANTNGTARRLTDEEEREAILADLRTS
jgi:hypothetical protein